MKIAYSIIYILVGFVIGSGTMCYLSALASDSYLDLVEITYMNDQKVLAAKYIKNDHIDDAIFHYRNLVLASTPPGLNCFNVGNEYWDFTFPFSSIILRKLRGNDSIAAIRRNEAINRALLACALDKGGYEKEAASEYSKASQLLGYSDDITKLKQLADDIISTDVKILGDLKTP